ncbi:hypothetical protein [Paenibacillus sp. sgz302251]|uniref:hypothetical protein n=1 Tax=Paenibacillus sp. sgz302251 TaxID=3414493 RepID=UPI003C7B3FEF
MQINLKKYIQKTVELMRSTGSWVELPDKPFDFVIDAEGIIREIRIRKKVMKTRDNCQLKYSEEGLVQDEYYDIVSHSYHFEGRTCTTKILKPFRIDLDKSGNLHANHDDVDPTIPHQLKYPEHIRLEIINYSLPVMIAVSNEYLIEGAYPLNNDFASHYNDIQNLIRKEII